MRPFSTFGQRHPLATSLIVLGIAAAWFVLPLLMRGPIDVTAGTGTFDLTDLRPFIVTEGLVATGLLVIVALLRWGQASGLRGPVDPAGLRLAGWFIVPATLIVGTFWVSYVNLADGAPIAPSLLSITIMALLIGLFEETLFRGVLLHGLRQAMTVGWAIIASGLLFGLFHVVNAVVGQNWPLTAIQMAGATGLGLFFAAITVQARSIWPAITLHALWDAFALSAPAALQLLPSQDQAAVPEPGLPALLVPALLSFAAYVIHRRWVRRMTAAGSRQSRSFSD